jgi:hypothetical protein
MIPAGALPKALFVIGSVAIYNAMQCFIPSMRLTHRIYARRPREGKHQFEMHLEESHLIDHVSLSNAADGSNDGNLDVYFRINPTLLCLSL